MSSMFFTGEFEVQKPLKRIYCKRCYFTQDYSGQKECIHCGTRLSYWHISAQLQDKKKQDEVNYDRDP
jgi:uncharacterized paraquat-inducible protein A